jgi:hypothetical protein
MQFPPASYYFVPLSSKYSQCPVLKNLQPTHSYKTRDKIWIFTFFDSRHEIKLFWADSQQVFHGIKYWFVSVVPKCLSLTTFSKNLLAIFIIFSYILVMKHEHSLSFFYSYFQKNLLTSN